MSSGHLIWFYLVYLVSERVFFGLYAVFSLLFNCFNSEHDHVWGCTKQEVDVTLLHLGHSAQNPLVKRRRILARTQPTELGTSLCLSRLKTATATCWRNSVFKRGRWNTFRPTERRATGSMSKRGESGLDWCVREHKRNEVEKVTED